jgi:hypothetical protein
MRRLRLKPPNSYGPLHWYSEAGEVWELAIDLLYGELSLPLGGVAIKGGLGRIAQRHLVDEAFRLHG